MAWVWIGDRTGYLTGFEMGVYDRGESRKQVEGAEDQG